MRLVTVALCITLLSLTCVQAQQVSSRKPSGLILSTGNLYFTSHDAAGAAVWRTSQTSVPGQESILYWEQGAKFGDIVFAQVNGVFFGYFFAEKAGVISIKRVPLSGGNAITLANVTSIDIANSRRNLLTDGINLYWQDADSVTRCRSAAAPSLCWTRQLRARRPPAFFYKTTGLFMPPSTR